MEDNDQDNDAAKIWRERLLAVVDCPPNLIGHYRAHQRNILESLQEMQKELTESSESLARHYQQDKGALEAMVKLMIVIQSDMKEVLQRIKSIRTKLMKKHPNDYQQAQLLFPSESI